MATTLDTLVLEFGADFSQLNLSVAQARKIGVDAAKQIEQAFKSVQVPTLSTLSVKVDLNQLHELNRLYNTVKPADHRRFQQFLDQNPLTVKVNSSQVKNSEVEVTRLLNSITKLKSAVNTLVPAEIKTSIIHKHELTDLSRSADLIRSAHRNGAEDIGKAINKAIKEFKPGGGGLLGAVLSPVSIVSSSLLQGVAFNVTKTFADGLEKSFSKNIDGGMSGFGEKFGDKLLSLNLKTIKKDWQKFEDNLVNVLEDVFVFKTKFQPDMIRKTAEDFANDMVDAISKGVATPFRIRKRVLLAQSGIEAQRRAEEITPPPAPRSQSTRSVAFVTGGINYQQGAINTDFAAGTLKQILQGAQIVPVYNIHANDPKGQGLIGRLTNKPDGSLMPMHSLLHMGVEAGYSKDAIEIVAQAIAYVKKHGVPKGGVIFAGTSGGAAIAEEATAISRRLGMDYVKGIGLTLPMTGLTGTAPQDSYRAFVGNVDPIYLAMAGTRGLSESTRNRPDVKRALSGYPLTGWFQADDRTTVFPNIGEAHHLGAFLSKPEVHRGIKGFLGDSISEIPEEFQGKTGRNNLTFWRQLQEEMPVISRSLKIIFGDLNEIAKARTGNFDGLSYSFFNPDHPDWRRDNDFAAMRMDKFSGKDGKKLNDLSGFTKEYAVEFDKFLALTNEGLREFYESFGSQQTKLQQALRIAAQIDNSLEQTLNKAIAAAGDLGFAETNFKFPERQQKDQAAVISAGQLAKKENEAGIVVKLTTQIQSFAQKANEARIALFKLEEQLTFGLAPAYRRLLGNLFAETAPLAQQYAGIMFRDRVALPLQNRVMPALGAGYSALQGAERGVLGLAPFGTGYAAKGLLQAGLGFSAINTFAPGIAGLLTGGGSEVGGALATQLGQQLTVAMQSQAPAFVQPIVSAIGQGITGLLSGAGSSAGAGLAAMAAGGTLAGFANRGMNRLLPPQRQQLNLLPASESPLNILKAATERIQEERALMSAGGAGLVVSELKSGLVGSRGQQTITDKDIAKLKIALLIAERITNTLEETREPQNFVQRNFPEQFENQFQFLLSQKGQAGQLRGRALDVIAQYAPSIKAAADAGDDTAQGFILAVQNAIPRLEKAASSTAQRYIARIKSELGIASPSRVMIKLGQDVVAGFELGLENLDGIEEILGRIFSDTGNKNAALRIDQYARTIEQQFKQGFTDIEIDLNDTLGKKVGQGVKDTLENVTPTVRKAIESFGDFIGQQLRFFAPEVADFLDAFNISIEDVIASSKSFLAVGAGVIGASIFGPGLINAANQTADLANEQNRFKRILDNTVGIGGDKYYERMAEQANRYGVNLQLAARSAASLETSLINTSFSGRGVDLLRGFQAQFANQGTPEEDQERALRGYEQIIRKRKLQTEELYQIIEPLPGAMEALSAATNKNTAELFRATAQGELYAEDFIEKFSRQLEIQSGIFGGADTPEASMQRMQNRLAMSGASVGQMTAAVRKGFTDASSFGLEVFNKNAELTNSIIATLTLTITGGFVVAMGLALKSLIALPVAATAAQLALGAMGKAIVPIAAIVATIQAVRFAWDLTQPTRQVNELLGQTRKLKSAIDELNQPIGQNRRETSADLFRKDILERSQERRRGGGNAFEAFTDLADFFGSYFDEQKLRNDVKATQEQLDIFKGLNESADKFLSKLKTQPQILANIKTLQTEIAELDAKRILAVNQGDSPLGEKLTAQIVEKQKELNKVLKDSNIDTYSATFIRQVKIIDGLIANLKEKDYLTPEQKTQLAELQKAKDAAQAYVNALERAQGINLAPLQQAAFTATQQTLTADAAVQERRLRQEQQRGVAFRQFGAPGTANSTALGVLQAQQDLIRLQSEQKALDEKIAILSKQTVAGIQGVQEAALSRFNTILESMSTTLSTATSQQLDQAIQEFESSGTPLPTPIKDFVANVLKQRNELVIQSTRNRSDIVQGEQALRQSELEKHNQLIQYQRAVRDGNENLSRTVAENTRQLQRAYEDAVIETGKMAAEIVNLTRNNSIRSRIQATAGDFTDQMVNSIQQFLDQVHNAVNGNLDGQSALLGINRRAEDLASQQRSYQLGLRGIQESINDNEASRKGQRLSLGGGAGVLLGITGGTGGSTGPHLDVRYPSDYLPGRPRPTDEHLSRLLVGGKPLTSFPITSEYGMRTHPVLGGRRFHAGVDFGTPEGKRITTRVPIRRVSPPFWDSKGGGWVTEVEFADGVRLMLLHQHESVRNAGVGGGTTAAPAPSTNVPQAIQQASQRVMASFYGQGDGFAGKRTANGEIYNPMAMTAASVTLPFGTMLRVTNPATGQATVVRINDRGPFAFDSKGKALQPLQEHPERKLDLSVAAARAIGLDRAGVGPVIMQVISSPQGGRLPGNVPLGDGNEAATLGQYSQQSALQTRLNALRRDEGLLQADRTYRDTMRTALDQVANLQNSGFQRRNETNQRATQTNPSSPITEAFDQYYQQFNTDRGQIALLQRETTKLKEDIAANLAAQQRLDAGLASGLPERQAQQYREMVDVLRQLRPEMEAKLKADEEYLALLQRNPAGTQFARNFRTAVDTRLQGVTGQIRQLDQIRALFNPFGTNDPSLAGLDVAGQFRSARLVNFDSKQLIDDEVNRLTTRMNALRAAGQNEVANEVQGYINSLNEAGAIFANSAKLLSPEAERIAVAAAMMQASYQNMVSGSRFNDALTDQTVTNLGLRARVFQGNGDTLSANALNLQAEKLKIQKEFTDKILENENNIRQLRLKAEVDPAANEQINTLEQINLRLKEMRELSLELAEQSFPTLQGQLTQTFSSGAGEAFKDIFRSLREGRGILESLGNAFRNLANRIIDSLLDIVAGFISSGAKGFLGKLFNFGGGGIFNGAGTITDFIPSGFGAGVAFNGGMVVGNLAKGGPVSVGLAAMQAMEKERLLNGGRPVGLYALTDREHVLNREDGDFWRTIKANGIWDNLKANLGYDVQNRSTGGAVGDYSRQVIAGSNRGSNIVVNIPIQPTNQTDADILQRIGPQLGEVFNSIINDRLIAERRDRGLFA